MLVGDMTHDKDGERHGIESVGRGDNIPNGRNSYQFTSWGNDTDRALYTAMRHHVQVTGDVPSKRYRQEAADSLVAGSAPKVDGFDSMEEVERHRDEMSQWRSSRDDAYRHPNKVALGKLLHEQPHVLELFQTGGESQHAKKMQAAAADALGHYKGLLDKKNAAEGRAPAGADAGWHATEEGLARDNALRQGWTLPLNDPETGEQYDNTTPHSGDPVFPVGGNPVTAKSRKK